MGEKQILLKFKKKLIEFALMPVFCDSPRLKWQRVGQLMK